MTGYDAVVCDAFIYFESGLVVFRMYFSCLNIKMPVHPLLGKIDVCCGEGYYLLGHKQIFCAYLSTKSK